MLAVSSEAYSLLSAPHRHTTRTPSLCMRQSSHIDDWGMARNADDFRFGAGQLDQTGWGGKVSLRASAQIAPTPFALDELTSVSSLSQVVYTVAKPPSAAAAAAAKPSPAASAPTRQRRVSTAQVKPIDVSGADDFRHGTGQLEQTGVGGIVVPKEAQQRTASAPTRQRRVKTAQVNPVGVSGADAFRHGTGQLEQTGTGGIVVPIEPPQQQTSGRRVSSAAAKAQMAQQLMRSAQIGDTESWAFRHGSGGAKKAVGLP